MKKYLFLICLVCIISLTGCRSNNESINNTNNEKDNQFMNVKNSTITEVNREDSEAVSRHLANLAASVPNVNDATAVALGRFAIVGIDVDKDLDRSKVGTIKYTVAESLKKDPYGANAIVVADPDFSARINDIRDDIKNGKPVQGILNELSEIVGRIIPEIPGDLKDPSIEKRTEEPKQQGNQKDKEKIDKEQKKQSNYHKNNE